MLLKYLSFIRAINAQINNFLEMHQNFKLSSKVFFCDTENEVKDLSEFRILNGPPHIEILTIMLLRNDARESPDLRQAPTYWNFLTTKLFNIFRKSENIFFSSLASI